MALSSISFLLPWILASSGAEPASPVCIRETAIERVTDHVRFWVAEIPEPAVVTEVSGDVHYQANDSAPELELRIGAELAHDAMLYLGVRSRVAARCGEGSCLQLRTEDEPQQYVLFPIQCP